MYEMYKAKEEMPTIRLFPHKRDHALSLLHLLTAQSRLIAVHAEKSRAPISFSSRRREVLELSDFVVLVEASEATLKSKARCCSEGPPGPLSPEKPLRVGAAFTGKEDELVERLVDEATIFLSGRAVAVSVVVRN